LLRCHKTRLRARSLSELNMTAHLQSASPARTVAQDHSMLPDHPPANVFITGGRSCQRTPRRLCRRICRCCRRICGRTALRLVGRC
jgi:hypothetical protein